MTLRFVPRGRDDEVARHCPILIAPAQHLACLDKQVTVGMVDQPHPFGGTGLRDDDLANGAGAFQGSEFDR